MLQKDIERFEIFGVDGKWLIKDNEQLPNLLNSYQSCARLNEFAKRIADLEAKLAESEEKYNACQEARKLEIEFNQQDKAELKQQLAEKEKENEELQDKLHSYYEQIMNKGTCGLCEYVRTDYKILFAVEQLEKVKEFCDGIKLSMVYISQEDTTKIQTIIEEIDNQIKELKKEIKSE